MKTLSYEIKTDMKKRAAKRDGLRFALEIIRTAIPTAILTMQILIYYQ
jgi:hypothetical protein